MPVVFSSTITLTKEGALSVLITRGNPADVFSLRVLARKRVAATTVGVGER